jgi:hypothetical protein
MPGAHLPGQVIGGVQIVQRVQQTGCHPFSPGQGQGVFENVRPAPGDSVEDVFGPCHAYQPVAAIDAWPNDKVFFIQSREGLFQNGRCQSGNVRSYQHHPAGTAIKRALHGQVHTPAQVAGGLGPKMDWPATQPLAELLLSAAVMAEHQSGADPYRCLACGRHRFFGKSFLKCRGTDRPQSRDQSGFRLPDPWVSAENDQMGGIGWV